MTTSMYPPHEPGMGQNAGETIVLPGAANGGERPVLTTSARNACFQSAKRRYIDWIRRTTTV
jgi:hypothetical protein